MGDRIVKRVTSIRIGRGVLGGVADGSETMIAMLIQPGASPIAERITTDLEGRGIGVEARLLPDAEAAKSFEVVEQTTAWMARIGLKRDGIVLGIGGHG